MPVSSLCLFLFTFFIALLTSIGLYHDDSDETSTFSLLASRLSVELKLTIFSLPALGHV